MPNKNDDQLSPKQERAIMALLSEPTLPRAAEAVGVHEKTIYRWLNDPIFCSVYRRTRREAFGQAIALTQKYAPVAVQTLTKLMMDPTTPAHVRVTAAATLLRFGREGIELDDLAARVDALEQTANYGSASGGGAMESRRQQSGSGDSDE